MVEEYFGTRHVVGQKQQVAGGPRQVVGWFRNAKGGSSVFRLSRPSTSLLLSQMPPHGITMGGIEWPIEPMPLTHRNYEPVESMRPLLSWPVGSSLPPLSCLSVLASIISAERSRFRKQIYAQPGLASLSTRDRSNDCLNHPCSFWLTLDLV